MKKLTISKITTVLNLTGKYGKEDARQYKAYYDYLLEITRNYHYSHQLSYITRSEVCYRDKYIKSEANTYCIIELNYYTPTGSGKSQYIIPANNYYYDCILIILNCVKQLKVA